MEGPGRDASAVLPDGRVLDYWEGGDPDGRGVVFHVGTPLTRVMGRLGHDTAVAHGVRLVSVSRPGYGGSTLPRGVPSLRRTGQDTRDLAGLLGLDEYAVLGSSGGAPFAVATAVADPERVRALGLVAGSGPWTTLNEPTDAPDDVEERRLLALKEGGDLDAAWAGYLELLAHDLGALADLDDEARVEAFFAPMGGPPEDPFRRAVWAVNLAEVARRPDGCAFDSLAWGASWDVDPRDVVAPTTLWYGDADLNCPPSHGQWYADRIAGAELVVLPGETHPEVCSDHWSEQLAALVGAWHD